MNAAHELGFSCGTCPCFNPTGTDAANIVQGICTRHPPTVVIVPGAVQLMKNNPPPPMLNSAQPPARADGWCWDYPQMQALLLGIRSMNAQRASNASVEPETKIVTQ